MGQLTGEPDEEGSPAGGTAPDPLELLLIWNGDPTLDIKHWRHHIVNGVDLDDHNDCVDYARKYGTTGAATD